MLHGAIISIVPRFTRRPAMLVSRAATLGRNVIGGYSRITSRKKLRTYGMRLVCSSSTGPSPTTRSTSARIRATTSGRIERMKNAHVSELAVVSWPARKNTPS